MNIQEDYVSFETAKLLKEKGFKGNCHAFDNVTIKTFGKRWNVESTIEIPIPTVQMAMKWLRKEYNIIISVAPQKDKYYFIPWQLWDSEWVHTKTMLPLYDTYEEACEAAIKYCLENLITSSSVSEQ